jgi:hypothetical protein
MEPQDSQQALIETFNRELSIRRVTRVLEQRRQRLVDEIGHFAASVELLLPMGKPSVNSRANIHQDILNAALDRLEDQAFAHWMQACLHNPKR